MRLTFPEVQHADVAFASGRTIIGSDPECDVQLSQSGISPRHAAIDLHPQRGLSLTMLQDGATVHVNGRPVSEFSFLRAGDCIALGSLRMEIIGDVVDALPVWASGEAPKIEGQASSAASRVVLRGISGKYFGRSIGLLASPVVGSGPDADLRLDDAALAARQARLELWPDAVVLRELAPGDGARINGLSVHNGELRHGDQVVFDQHRFVLEAPGLPAQHPARRPITGVHEAVPDAANQAPTGVDAEGPARSSRIGHTAWWLVGAAALIAAIFARLVY